MMRGIKKVRKIMNQENIKQSVVEEEVKGKEVKREEEILSLMEEKGNKEKKNEGK